MIETSLVYIHAGSPENRFVGCGALIEGDYIATCRHVWTEATRGAAAEDVSSVNVRFPRSRRAGQMFESEAALVFACEGLDDPAPDLVLLRAREVPSGVVTLQLARAERYETGQGQAHARLARLDASDRVIWRDNFPKGRIDAHIDENGLREFSGTEMHGYWFTRGSSGSPVFALGQQLAGILSLSELGTSEDKNRPHVAFIVPATTILRYLERLQADAVARREGLSDDETLRALEEIRAMGVPAVEIPSLLAQFVTDARGRAHEPIAKSNDGADIDATIGAARARLETLDASGARALLQAKLDEEEQTYRKRRLPLLRERVAIERLAFDHAAAEKTWLEIVSLEPDDPWNWIELGDLRRLTDSLSTARAAYETADAAARRAGNERDVSVCQNRIGDALMAEGDRAEALAAYRAGLAILEPLARRDPGHTLWQHDLSVSQCKIGDALIAEGDRAEALAAYRAGLAILEPLARRDPGNTTWQRDLSVSHNKIGDALIAEGDRAGALAAYRAGLAIMEALARRDPGDTAWQRDLSVSQNKVGDALMAEGDRAGALAAYRAGLAIREPLARRDPGNTEWRRDLSVSQNKVGDALLAEGDRAGALAAYRAGLATLEPLARRDPGNTLWQRDLSVSQERIGEALMAEGDRAGALAAYRAGLDIREPLVRRDPGNTLWRRDLSVGQDRIGDVLLAEGDRAGALAAYRAGLAIREVLARRDPGNTEWQRDLIVSCVKIAEAEPEAGHALLTRALRIARALEASGRLAPVDAWIPDDLARQLGQLPPKPASS